VFQKAQQCLEKGDHDYAHDLLAQCLVEDPGNLIFLQHFITNLSKKYGNNKKGSRFASFKLQSSRSALGKSIAKGNWPEAFQSGCDALKHNPWDTGTLLLLAEAEQQLGHHECQLYLLRWALDADTKDPGVNRRAAQALGQMGQFDQAISCWRRVEQAKPGDEEAAKAISQLSVEKTIHQGGYSSELLGNSGGDVSALDASLRGGMASPASRGKHVAKSDEVEEQELLAAVDKQPAEIGNYGRLAEWYRSRTRLTDAERVLTKALAASGGGDLTIREQLEDVQLQRVRQQVEVAERRAKADGTKVSAQLARKMADQANQMELEVYAARSARTPGNPLLQFELGLRLKRAGKFKEAIQALQAARDDSKRQAQVQLNLGECFQQIRQFSLAASSYAAAVEAATDADLETRKLALYRAGNLAIELKELDRAEKYLTTLAAIDFGYRDVADRLDKLAAIRDHG
jgi:tetratricopeptide (TPR) repeat protein